MLHNKFNLKIKENIKSQNNDLKWFIGFLMSSSLLLIINNSEICYQNIKVKNMFILYTNWNIWKYYCCRLQSVLPASTLKNIRIPLQQLSLGWEESLLVEELQALANLCPDVVELKGVSVGILDDQYRGDRHLQVLFYCILEC